MQLFLRSSLILALIFVGRCHATCFQNRDELAQAVSDYLGDNSPDTEVAKAYGWPIGTWCVSDVTDFSDIFMNAVDFNEDLSQWDTSRAPTMPGMLLTAS